MGSWSTFLLTYLLGGVTFIPLVVVAVLLHAYLTFPVREDIIRNVEVGGDSIVQPGDDTTDLKAAQKALKEEAKPRVTDPTEVAAGYFAVCREYTPMGINAKPIERSTPVGSTTVAAPSQSVYQAMYRSIFDRKQSPSPADGNTGASARPKKAGNVFYVVLRHGHLMLFDDDEQLEVRHVISLAHHHVSIYSGGDTTPEGELFIKRNALCLSRKSDGHEMAPDTQISKPFYLFSENCSAKEDFYFALLRNKEQVFGASDKAPQPQQFDVKNIISLVQKLHSSEEHMQTRWLNALIGRLFLGVYKTRDMENSIREKLTKKISRVKRPAFLSRIAIQNIETGDSAPLITNPRLKDLTVEGEFMMEADVKYTGNCRLEVAATARIDLGTRFKVREVNLILAVVFKRLEGHILFKVKPPPSNRIWFSFQTMPKMEMSIEPIVSSRQITYTVILRQIENRIKEVVAETLVNPFWDDIPFFKTEHKQWRGGVFQGDDAVEHSEDYEAIAAALGDVDEVAQMEDSGSPTSPTTPDLPPMEKSHSLPVIENTQNTQNTQPTGFWGRISKKSTQPNNANQGSSASTTALDIKSQPGLTPETPRPRPIRQASISTSSPTVVTDPAHAETFRPSSPPFKDDVVSAIATAAAISRRNSSGHTSQNTPSRPSSMTRNSDHSSNSSSETLATEGDKAKMYPTQPRRSTTSSAETSTETAQSKSPALPVRDSFKSTTGSLGRSFFSRTDNSSPVSNNGSSEQKRTALAAVSNAAATARRWGLSAISRQSDLGPNGRKLSDPPVVDLNKPMGRGQPLPPPGVPLPGPDKRSRVTTIPVPKRTPLPPPEIRPRQSPVKVNEAKSEPRKLPPPPLPRRRRVSDNHMDDSGEENVLVVSAPTDSEPTTPRWSEHGRDDEEPGYMQPWVEDTEDTETALMKPVPPELPKRQQIDEGETVGKMASVPVIEDEDDYSNWLDNPEFAVQEPEPEPITAAETGHK